MKRIWLCVVASVCLIFAACFTFSASAAEIVKSGICGANGSNLTWTLTDDGVLEIGGNGDMKNYSSSNRTPWYSYEENITTAIIGDSVTSIGGYAFYNCNSLANITIPDSVTSIGSYAFCTCDSLENVTIGNSVTSIGVDAFYNCDSLVNVTIPDSVTSIGGYAFYDCDSLVNVTIPDSVTSIGGYAFYDCDSLENVTIGNSVTSIGVDAFYDCDSLTSVTIPKAITSISDSSFGNCQQLIIYGFTGSTADSYASSNSIPFVSLDGFMPNYIDGGQCGDNAYWELYRNGKLLITGTGKLYNETITSSPYVREVEIASGITNIGSGAFSGSYGLTNITIPDSVTSIGSSAFYYCYSLANITIPDSVTSIGSSAFDYCYSLEKVHISSIDSWMNISFTNNYSNPLNYGADLYLNGERFTNLTIPNNMKKVKDYVFSNCKSLKTITIPKTVTSIPDNAFTGCTNATIYGYANTCAETTARANILPFVALDDNWQPKLSYNGKCGNNIMWQLYQDGRLVLGFMNDVTSDAIYDYTTSSAPTWNTYASLVRTVDFPKGITRVGDYAFDKLTGIVTVNYGGSESSWKKIEIGSNNTPFEKAYVIYGESVSVNINYKDVLKTTAKVNGKIIPVIINLVEGTTWQELKANLVYSDYTNVIVYNHDGIKITDEDPLSTGYILHHVNKDGSVIEEVLISVSGDVTGDSVVNIDDIHNVAAHLAGSDNELNKIAIDKNLDDVLTMEEFNKFIATFR